MNQRLIPCPEYVTFTNLRRYLDYLSDPNSLAVIRENFYTHNPIPRVEWDVQNHTILSDPNSLAVIRENFYTHNPIPRVEWDVQNHTILNADAIMPQDYEPEYPSRKEVSKAGYNRIKVEMKTLKDVINLVNNSALKANNLHAYVPKHLTEIRGVIKFVDTSISEEKLLQSIECDGMVKGVKRIYKKIIKDDKSIQMVPRQTVIVSFYGNKLPPFVYINSCRM
ncbi:hypothetical protein QE152_g40312 [Popillia japonica]|uniref:Uncharacterized protein n=1 Tax=Popillia japonica TaxID=7064 RepID=A0AAW1HSC0_POPJA